VTTVCQSAAAGYTTLHLWASSSDCILVSLWCLEDWTGQIRADRLTTTGTPSCCMRDRDRDSFCTSAVQQKQWHNNDIILHTPQSWVAVSPGQLVPIKGNGIVFSRSQSWNMEDVNHIFTSARFSLPHNCCYYKSTVKI